MKPYKIVTNKIFISLLLSILVFSTGITVFATAWQDFKQADAQWGGNPMGDGNTIALTGCFVTAVAIQSARSGLTKTADNEDINPGTVASAMLNHGGLINGNLYQTEVGSAIPGFDHDSTNREMGGLDDASKLQAIQQVINKGFYPTIQTNNIPGGTHFVAVKEVKDGVVYMYDPASSSDNFSETYGNSSIIQLNAFKGKVPIQDAKEGASTNDTVEVKEDDGTNLIVKTGSFDEDDIPGMPKKRDYEDDDIVIKLSDLVKPDNDETESVRTDDQLQLWINEYKDNKKFSGVTIIRALVIATGRLLLIYAVLLIATFYFDRVGLNFLKTFNLATMGRLEVSYNNESTYRDKNSSIRLVTQANLFSLVIILVLFGTILINGNIFGIIDYIVDFWNFMYDLITNTDWADKWVY